MIAQRMKEAVGIGGHRPAAQHHGVAQAGAGRRDGQLVESLRVDVVVGVGHVFQQVGAAPLPP